jgi:small subunit ribosomal protein S16
MLAIRMQRTGRKGHAQFRLIVQESRRSPKSGNIVAALGSYDPHTKKTSMDKEKATYFLSHGAQPSTRVALLLQKEGVKLPKWVKIEQTKQAVIRNADKRRSTRPVDETASEPATTDQIAEKTETKVTAVESTDEPIVDTIEDVKEEPEKET